MEFARLEKIASSASVHLGWVRWGILIFSFLLFFAAAVSFYPRIGFSIWVISLLPVGLAGALLGPAAGLGACLITLVGMLAVAVGQGSFAFSRWLADSLIPGVLVQFFFGWLTGRMHDQAGMDREQPAEKEPMPQALHRRDAILEAVGSAAGQFLLGMEWGPAMQAVLERLGGAAGASHVYLVENRTGPNGELLLNLEHEWTAPEADPRQQPSLAQPLSYSGPFARWEDAFRQGQAIYGSLESFPEEEREILSAYSVRSIALVPVSFKQTWLGYIGFDDCSSDRTWTGAEIDAFKAAAGFVGASRFAQEAIEAERQERQFAEALRHTAAVLNRSLDLDQVLDQILSSAEQVVPSEGVNLMLIENGAARTVRCRGYMERGLREAVMGLQPEIDRVPSYREMRQTGKPVLIQDTRKDPRWIALEETHWVTSYLGAPISVKGEVIGFVNLDSGVPGFFTQRHAEHIQAFTDQAAVAIENARLFAATQENTRNSQLLNQINQAALGADSLAEMMRQIAHHLKEMFQADGVYLTHWDEAAEGAVPVAAAGPLAETYPFIRIGKGNLSMTGRILSTERVYIAEGGPEPELVVPPMAEAFREHAVIGLPLIAGSQKLGAAIITFPAPHHFSGKEISLAIQSTGQLALAIAKASLLETGRERISQLTRINSLISALGHVATRIESHSSQDSVIQTLGQELSLLGLSCWVALRESENPSAMSIRYISAQNNTRLARWMEIGLNHFIISPDRFPLYEQVIAHHKSVFLDNPRDLILATVPGLNEFRIEQISELTGTSHLARGIYAPLTAEDEVIGLLLVWGEGLMESEAPAVTVFASQVAVAIQNTRLYAALQKLAVTDELTGLSNRRQLFELGQREVEISYRFDRPLSVLMIDIDYFKTVNDRFGHTAGDAVVKEIANRLRGAVREVDIVSRYGGEEFLILLLEIQREKACQVAERIRRSVAGSDFVTDQGAIPVTISIGVAELTQEAHDLNRLIQVADQALYQAKQNGRNCVCAIPPNCPEPVLEA